MADSLPGTLWLNRGRWNWKVRLPGAAARKNYPLRMPGQSVAIAEAKGRSLAESIAWRMWEGESRKAAKAHDNRMTLDEACAAFLRHAETYYRRPDGSPTREAVNCEIALRTLRAAYGVRPIDDLSYKDALAARDGLVEAGLYRATINQRVGVWRRFVSWALENRLCSPQTKAEIWAISNLKRGRSPAPEGQPVMPVPHKIVKKTVSYLPPNLRAMVLLQELCGARPSEVCAMRPCDIERRRGVWVYRPATHKTAHKGNVRVIVLGPRAQRILTPIVASTPAQGHVFSPSIAQHERGKVGAGEQWTATNYAQAIRRACRAAGIPVWSPNQLRHACGTRVRRKVGAEAASVVLGHSQARSARVTDTYTRSAIEREIVRASTPAMLLVG